MSDLSNPYRAPEATLSSVDTPKPEGTVYTTPMLDHLRATKPWVRLFAVLGFISSGIMILLAVGILVAGFMAPDALGFGGIAGGVLYLALALLYIIPTLSLNRFAGSIGNLLKTGRTEDMEKALGHQKSFWKFAGIVTLVAVGVGFVVMIGGFIIGISAFL